MYFVVEWVTISTPNSNGRQLIGVAKVLSQIIGTPCSCGKFNKLVNVKYNTCRVGNRLGKDSFGVRLECFFQLLCRRILVHEGSLDAESF